MKNKQKTEGVEHEHEFVIGDWDRVKRRGFTTDDFECDVCHKSYKELEKEHTDETKE